MVKNRRKNNTDILEAKNLFFKLFSLRIVKVTLIVVLAILVSPLILFAFLRPKPAPTKELNYGITFSKKYAEQINLDWQDTYIKILDDLKVKNLRLIAYWDDIETQHDVFNFYDIKWQLEEARKRDVKVILTLGRKVPRYPECFEPTWWHELSDTSLKNAELYEYVKETVTELKHFENITMWQVENEPFFPFGKCELSYKDVIETEVGMVRQLDDRPIIVQDSGEGGWWSPTYLLGDYLAISMYRKIWFDFWNLLFGQTIYFEYPLAYWSYKIKADLLRIPADKIIITELQAEPWGPVSNDKLTQEQKDITMSREDFLSTISYAQKTGFKDFYLWGAEWWLWEKETQDNPFFWDTAKALFSEAK